MRKRQALFILTAVLAGPAVAEPQYTAKGELVFPKDYRDWVFLASSLDMNYAAGSGAPKDHVFDNIFVDPAAWAVFQKTGHWPDKTVFVKENRVGATDGSINKAGQFQTEGLVGYELHVRDDARFKDGWGFFGTDGRPAARIDYQASCYSCHQMHGASQSTFTQFYPTAKPIAQKAGNYADR